jgi:Uma2 family endonuclease
MPSQIVEKISWTSADLELFPEDDKIYEIIEGELLMTRAPDWKHQKITGNVCSALSFWSKQTGLGEAVTAPGIIFTDTDNVIPDVVWVSQERLTTILDEAGHLTAAPELIVEVLSPGKKQERRDRQLKLKLYSIQGVQEYWIVDRDKQQVEVYRRENAILKLEVALFKEDNLTSPLLPGFSCLVGSFFE